MLSALRVYAERRVLTMTALGFSAGLPYFLVFDTLAVFLFPWVLVVRTLGMPGIAAMCGFLAILGLGWVYAYRERILEWQ